MYQAVDYPDRKIAKSVLIRDLEPTLNESLLSWTYFRLILEEERSILFFYILISIMFLARALANINIVK